MAIQIVRESLYEDQEYLKKERYETPYGYIDHGYRDGLLVFMGSYIYKEYRGQGKFKEMVKSLLSKFPEGTTVQVPVENKVLEEMFVRMGFHKVKSIEYWGELSNATLMQGTITPETLNLI